MHIIEVPSAIQRIMDIFRKLGFWHSAETATVKETNIKWFYSVYYLLTPISLLSGAYLSDYWEESVFLVEATVITSVALVKLLYLIWKKDEIVELVQRLGVHSIEDRVAFISINRKLKNFVKFVTVFCAVASVMGSCVAFAVPFVGSERKLFFNIGFPLDWKNNEFAYWTAFTFILTEGILSIISVAFSTLVWYLLLNCSLKYDNLASKLRNLGEQKTVGKALNKSAPSMKEKEDLFYQDLIEAIESHKDITESTNQLGSFFADLFSVQLATSAFCICCSVYSLAFTNQDNLMESAIYLLYLAYTIFDIFMVMFFANEIQLSSGQLLSYSLFESNWIDQSEANKKCVCIFGERLMQAEELVILKLYPLNLETFTRILNSAYSMFNILKNF